MKSLLETLEVEFGGLPRGKALAEVNRLSFDGEWSHDSPDCGFVEALESQGSLDRIIHRKTLLNMVDTFSYL